MALTRDAAAALLDEAQRAGNAALSGFPDRKSSDWAKLARALDTIEGVAGRLRVTPLPDRILAVMRAHDGRNDYKPREIAMKLQEPTQTVRYHLGRLRSAGSVHRTQGSRNGYVTQVYVLPRSAG